MSQTAITWQQRLTAYYYLCRFDKPIGTELVYYPTMWALFIASQGFPNIKILIILTLGAIFMRAAGCAINDFADRKVDAHVERTKNRPLATGVIRGREAVYVFIFFVILSASLLLFLPIKAFYWSLGAVILAFVYPFMKRFTYLPQVFLGMAFSWSIPLAYAAVDKTPDMTCWLLYFANLAWTVAYDTQYAMTDREYDIKIGVKSTAILFGRYDLFIIGLLQLASICLLAVVFYIENMLMPYGMICLIGMLLFFIHQYIKTKNRDPQWTFWAFLNNRWVGLWIWLFIILALV